MTSLSKVSRLIVRLSPVGICDDCLTGLAGLPKRSDARTLVRELAGTGGFERKTAKCCMCEQARQVTRNVG